MSRGFIRFCRVDRPDLFTLNLSCELTMQRERGGVLVLGCLVSVSVFIQIGRRSEAASPALHNNRKPAGSFTHRREFIKLQYGNTEVRLRGG